MLTWDPGLPGLPGGPRGPGPDERPLNNSLIDAGDGPLPTLDPLNAPDNLPISCIVIVVIGLYFVGQGGNVQCTYDINTWSWGSWGSRFTCWSVTSGITLNGSVIFNHFWYLHFWKAVRAIVSFTAGPGGPGGPCEPPPPGSPGSPWE